MKEILAYFTFDKPVLTNDAVILGLLLTILAIVFQTEKHPRFGKFYKYVPGLLLCYFIPGLLNSFNVVSGESSKLYFVSSRYLLPASLVLLCISLDFKALRQLGAKAIIMFFAGTLGVLLGGPIALIIIGTISPETVSGEGANEVWRGMATIAGSWIGGGANQTALKEVFGVDDALFSTMIAVDVLTANIWMAILLYGASMHQKIDAWLGADNAAIAEVQARIEANQSNIAKIPTLTDLMTIVAVGVGCTGLAHFFADLITPWMKTNAPFLEHLSLTSDFFWIVILATSFGLILSFNKNIRLLEGAGASKVGSLFLYILVATIGMKMNILAIFDKPLLFLIGVIWMSVHAIVLILVAKWIKAPLFFASVGSMANIGGAASAPVVASAYHPSLAPIGVLLAVLGYAVGTYGGWLCGIMMQAITWSLFR